MRTVAGLVVGMAILAVAAPVAHATFASSSSASHALTSATLLPPSGVSAVAGGCLHGGSSVVVSWTVSPSAWADGYEIALSTEAGGPAVVVAVVDGVTAVAHDVGGLQPRTTYHVTMRSTAAAWRSVETPSVAVTTDARRCR